jgi:hypothetical protein
MNSIAHQPPRFTKGTQVQLAPLLADIAPSAPSQPTNSLTRQIRVHATPTGGDGTLLVVGLHGVDAWLPGAGWVR